MWPDILNALRTKTHLTTKQIDFAFTQMLSSEVESQIVREFLLALKAKGETANEVQRASEVILELANDFPDATSFGEITIDTCGTGGDGLHTLNISTMVALVIATFGTTVLKHGNRAASSKSGSADALEALGINLNPGVETLAQSAKEAKIAFLFAQAFHPGLKFVAPVRRELGVRTIFNILGPLVNPARPNTQVVGVSDENLAEVVATSLSQRGVRSIVLRGKDGLDEVSIEAATDLWVAFNPGEPVQRLEISPETFGEKAQSLDHIRGGGPHENAKAIVEMAEGRADDIVMSAVAMNAACALVAIDAHSQDFSNLEERLRSRYRDAQDLIRSGELETTLALWQANQK